MYSISAHENTYKATCYHIFIFTPPDDYKVSNTFSPLWMLLPFCISFINILLLMLFLTTAPTQTRQQFCYLPPP